MNRTEPANVLPQRFYNTRQAAAAYGVSGDTLIGAVKTGRLRAKRSGENGGGLYLFKPEWLEEWAENLIDG